MLLAELKHPDKERHLAFRNGIRYAPRLIQSKPVMNMPSNRMLIRADGTYLITGGLGGLGLVIAKQLVEQGARHLVLTGRSGGSDSALKTIAILKEQGANIVIIQADVSQENQVQQLLAEVKASLPPLRGIVHDAGVIADGLLAHQEWNNYERVLAPKAYGAWNLHSNTLDAPLDFFVLFSSMSALMGSPGQSNYAAANAFLDSFADYRRDLGLPALCINWGAWSDVGMAAALNSRITNRWVEHGIGLISPQAGMMIFGKALDSDLAHLGVFPVSWQLFLQQYHADAEPTLLSELAQEYSLPVHQESDPQQEFNLLQQINAAPADERNELLLSCVRQQVAQVLDIDPGKPLDINQGLTELGMDSLMAVELANNFQHIFDVSLPSAIVFEYPTIKMLADYLTETIFEDEPQSAILIKTEAKDKRNQDLDLLSPEEMESSLLEELDKSGF